MIICITDSDWAVDRDIRRSVTVYCVYFDFSFIIWFLKKQSVVVLFFTEAEYAVLISVVQEVMYIKFLLNLFGFFQF